MKTFKMRALAAGTAAALSLAAGTTQAAGVAYSNLNITGFQLFNSAGTQWNFADFSSLGIANDSQDQAFSNNFGSDSHAVPPPAVTGADVLQACVGPACAGIPQNTFTQQGGPHFSRADALLTGSILAGVPGTPNQANANTVAELQFAGTDAGNSSANVGTASRFVFNLRESDVFDFRFNADGTLNSVLDQPEFSSRTSYRFGLTITNLDNNSVVFSWNPDGTIGSGISGGTEVADSFSLSDECSVVGLATNCTRGSSGAFQAITGLLSAGVNYQLTITHTSTAALSVGVTPAPEPTSLALMGIGLLGASAMRRRRNPV
jgi:hypothetical protein